MSNASNRGQRPNRFLDPNAGNDLLRLKRDLVAQLFARDGAFWEAVRKLRSEWRIEPVRRLPPRNYDLFHPEDLCRPPQEWGKREDWVETLEEYRLQWKPFDDEDDLDNYQAWERDLESIVRATIPHGLTVLDASDWPRFVAACALCDPPETALLEFADWGGLFAPDLLLDEADDDSVVASFFSRRLPEIGSRVRPMGSLLSRIGS